MTQRESMGEEMRLKEIVAEHLYLEATNYNPICPFVEQDSNVRDFYCRLAADKLPHLLSGYFRGKGYLTKLIRGCIRDFINAHQVILNEDNSESLVKRIVSNLRKE